MIVLGVMVVFYLVAIFGVYYLNSQHYERAKELQKQFMSPEVQKKIKLQKKEEERFDYEILEGYEKIANELFQEEVCDDASSLHQRANDYFKKTLAEGSSSEGCLAKTDTKQGT